MQRIIAGTDFSPPSKRAVRAAARLSQRLGAALDVAFVYDPFPVAAAAMTPLAFWPALDLTSSSLAFAETGFAALARDELHDVPHETVTLSHANPALALCAYAEEVTADLVVVGTHGATGWTRVLLGGVATQVVRHAPCAVLVAREGADRADFPRHMLVCTDLSPAAEAGLDLAARLAPALEARVTLLHAQDELRWQRAGEVAAEGDTHRLESQLQHALERIHRDRFPPPANTALLFRQSVPRGIVAYAEELGADLIVLATHGRTGVARLLIGSVAERVTRDAPVSVLVARSSADAFLTRVV